jgi:tetratricopeptide (TPR) repeat protein
MAVYHDISEVTFNESRDALRRFRDQGTRQSLMTLKIGRNLIENNAARLGDEQWDVYEQIFVAAIDIGDFALADHYLQVITAQFPESKRVWRLAGLLQEASGDVESAIENYQENLKVDSGDAASTKRIISLLKNQGRMAECVSELNKYLSVYQCDAEGWFELAEVYLSEYEYEKAAFCFEELIILNPSNYIIYQRYAETKATIGGVENLKISKKYFCQSARMSGFNSNRALLGLVVVCEQLQTTKGVSAAEKQEMKELIEWANDKLQIKSEKARNEVTRNYPKRRNDEKILQHIETGVETLTQIVDSLKL